MLNPWNARRSPIHEVILEQFENPDEVRTFEKGKFELVHLGGMTIGRATYDPGWKWSEHVGKALGKTSCDVSHVGMVISVEAPPPWTTAASSK
jgi:hypothetical protein